LYACVVAIPLVGFRITALPLAPVFAFFFQGNLSGIVSERDVIQKVALLDCPPTEVRIKEINTPNPVTVDPDLSIDECMTIMIKKDIRHLPIVSDADGTLVGMISIKDCVKLVIDQKEETIQILTNFAMGKSGNFVVD
jgi:CBS domain-containing protein